MSDTHHRDLLENGQKVCISVYKGKYLTVLQNDQVEFSRSEVGKYEIFTVKKILLGVSLQCWNGKFLRCNVLTQNLEGGGLAPFVAEKFSIRGSVNVPGAICIKSTNLFYLTVDAKGKGWFSGKSEKNNLFELKTIPEYIEQHEKQKSQQSPITQMTKSTPLCEHHVSQQEQIKIEKVETQEKVPKEENTAVETLEEKDLCKVCFLNSKDCVVVPCGHRCCCSECAKHMKKCPICGKTDITFVKTFDV
ncbi:hypothetical protein EIN_181460 [Entamoeba invadens IP1]|uniref:hypothetical protein n=1 Tax=Entamoeba invadens IP1 TaxID=370355 RepID=UPI0002C3EDEC|nr:hypothetical protein EIN_181460 [Entamoeba invadens IP1]ELP93979.1 hypothetical protein EIN_181460 [Entamoeba invadens IP1]|eukprot:XP_004260750.1 hypothetical protein EIN_181460 [Entamoeba invadens IP1]